MGLDNDIEYAIKGVLKNPISKLSLGFPPADICYRVAYKVSICSIWLLFCLDAMIRS